MNFLERMFSLSPDGGSGATEVLLLIAIAMGVLAVFLLPSRMQRTRGVFDSRPVQGDPKTRRVFEYPI